MTGFPEGRALEDKTSFLPGPVHEEGSGQKRNQVPLVLGLEMRQLSYPL